MIRKCVTVGRAHQGAYGVEIVICACVRDQLRVGKKNGGKYHFI